MILNESETISTQQGEKLAKEQELECSALTQVFFESFLLFNLLYNF